MTVAFLLWLIGLILILLEFYLPGAILGIIGAICLFISVIQFASQSQSLIASFFYLIGVLVSVALLIRYALWRIRHAKPERSIYSNAHQTGYVASKFDKNAIGKMGIVVSDLKPGGYIVIEGKQHQAISQSGYLVKGSEVVVISGQEESLIVKSIKKGAST